MESTDFDEQQTENPWSIIKQDSELKLVDLKGDKNDILGVITGVESGNNLGMVKITLESGSNYLLKLGEFDASFSAVAFELKTKSRSEFQTKWEKVKGTFIDYIIIEM